ncbi:MAG: hypothetical protein ACK4M1_00125 [Flavobacterium sp.]
MKKIVIVVLFIISAIHFYIKNDELTEYNRYPGKIIGFTDVNVTYPNYGYKNYQYDDSHVTRHIPIVEYTNNTKEKIVYEDGTRVLFTNFDLNETVEVLESKKNKYSVRIFSFFYYWLYIFHLIIILMLTGIISVFFQIFVVDKGKAFTSDEN